MEEISRAPVKAIAPTDVRYIKLGPGGAWFEHALANNMIELGHAAISHDLARVSDVRALRAAFLANGAGPSVGAFANELRDFALLPESTLWLTIERGLLWWAFAAPGLIELAPGGGDHGARARRLMAPWRCDDLAGEPLRVETLSGKLTRVAGFKKSICRVQVPDYAVRRINAAPSDLRLRAEVALSAMVGVAGDMIQELDPFDFEVLVDLIFARSGWRRVSALGGIQADTDFILVHPTTGERAFVQVKSAAGRAVFEKSVRDFRQSHGVTRMFFACHSPEGDWLTPDQDVVVWRRDTLAAQAVEAGPVRLAR